MHYQIKYLYSSMDGWTWEICEGRRVIDAGWGKTRQDCERQAKIRLERITRLAMC